MTDEQLLRGLQEKQPEAMDALMQKYYRYLYTVVSGILRECGGKEDVEELLSVDMGCVGEGLECTDRQVSICVKDGHGPYHYDVVKGLIQAAKDNHIDYAADVYPYYGSDADAALSAGIDARHGLIGPGVYASHGYERSHKDAVAATLELLKAYLA